MGAPTRKPGLTAVLLDMDGVVTDTAQAHAAAWKQLFDEFLERWSRETGTPFDPFEVETDYRQFVDGKPRYEGVADFLHSRGIDLPRGEPDDAADAETICGLGNRKNTYFQDWLSTNRVETFATTIALIQAFREAGIPVAVFSSSRNCAAVLRNAGVDHLFDARIDGTDLDQRNLPGKPDPAMLLDAAARLAAEPEHTAVLEDSIAGVSAAVRGGFTPVVGIDREGQEQALLNAGAEMIVGDAGELTLTASHELAVRRLDSIPSLWEHQEQLAQQLAGASLALFLDYDGTLTPIVREPSQAVLTEAMRSTLARLAQRWPVAVISGRALADLRERVNLAGAIYAGSHGFELAGPDFEEVAEGAERFLPALDDAETELRDGLAAFSGCMIERKPFAIAVHYRQAEPARVDEIESIVDQVLARQARLRKSKGKKVFQVRPALAWDKGKAVLYILDRLGLNEALPIYIGDDITDEDAFRVLADGGITIALRDGARGTSADYALSDVHEVKRFLDTL